MSLKKNIIVLFLFVLLNACVGSSTGGVFGTGVSVALDPRTLGTQIDDSIMQKNLLARLVKNNVMVKQKFSFKNTTKDILITSQLRVALILNKNVKSANFNIDTLNRKTYVFGIAHSEEEKKEIIQEAKQIVDLKEIVTSILMVSDLSRQKE